MNNKSNTCECRYTIHIARFNVFLAQFLKEGHLRWDSLGEYLATAIGFEVGYQHFILEFTIGGGRVIETLGLTISCGGLGKKL